MVRVPARMPLLVVVFTIYETPLCEQRSYLPRCGSISAAVGIAGKAIRLSGRALQQHATYVADCLGRIETFRANVHAVHDAAATKNAERII